MSLDIQTSIPSLMAASNIRAAAAALSTTFNALSSGYRINNAADDPQGMASTNMLNIQVLSLPLSGSTSGAISLSQANAAYGANLQSAEAQIADVDIAAATAQLSQQQVLQQAGTAALAQANQAPSLALKLLG
jgi:flagellin